MNFIYKEGIDYVVEDGFWIWTEKFLLERGFCCENGCKNCPYLKQDVLKEKPSEIE